MFLKSTRCILLFICLLNFYSSFAGGVKGKVLDRQTGEPLAGATIQIENGSFKRTTAVNLDGTYTFKNIPEGTYQLKVKYIGYAPLKEFTVTVGSGNTIAVQNIDMKEEGKELEEIEVTGAGKNSDRAARGLEKNSVILQNVLSQKAIELLPDVTVANALQRISGVAIQRSSSGEGRYAIIRGMDQRYNTTLVNGVKIPSPDPDYRYIPMDLFPSEMLERLEVIKSLIPSMEGDAVGGTMNLVMKSAPRNFLLTANGSTGFSTLFSSGRPFTEFQHGTVNPKSPAELFGNNYSATQNDFSRGNLNFTNRNLPFNATGGLTIGGRTLNQHLGIIFSGAYQNIYRGSNSELLVPNAQPQVVGDLNNQSVISDLYTRRYSTQTTRWGLHNKFDYVFNNRNQISLYNMYIHMNEFQTRSTYDSVYLNRLADYLMRSRTMRQSIYNSTLRGDHTLSSQFRLNWTGAYSIARNNMPDMAEYDYQSGVVQSTREWQRNKNQDLAGYLNMFYTPVIAATDVEFNFGGMYRHRTRDNYDNPYSMKAATIPETWTGFNAANYAFTPSNTSMGSITASNPNTYTSHENVSAGYVQVKFRLGKKLEILGGARVEHTEQGYTTVMPESFAGRYGSVKYTDLLPSANLKYELNDKQNLRLSYFRSIVRPDFFEIIPTERVGEVFNILGNDTLKHSKADNFDIRYELFPGGADQFLVGAFYKSIQDPIEYAITRNGGPSAQFLIPENFSTAHNYGVEAVFTKYFGMFGISANYTYTKSRITTTKLYFYRDATIGITSKNVDQVRPLQGQADHIGNLSLLYKNPKAGLDVQLAFVYTGKRIAQVSPYYNLDYWQLGQGVLDLSFEKSIGRHFAFYGKLNNLTNAPFKTVIMQAPLAGNNFPNQSYSNKTVVGKDIYQVNILGGFRYKF
jgi:hypothetical protein